MSVAVYHLSWFAPVARRKPVVPWFLCACQEDEFPTNGTEHPWCGGAHELERERTEQCSADISYSQLVRHLCPNHTPPPPHTRPAVQCRSLGRADTQSLSHSTCHRLAERENQAMRQHQWSTLGIWDRNRFRSLDHPNQNRRQFALRALRPTPAEGSATTV